jgi:hypothetical protein
MMFSTYGEVEMPTLNTMKIFAPLLVVAALAISPAFGAAKGTAGKKLTREQAWAFCKAKLDERFGWDQSQSRYAAGGSCMKRFGYSL